MIKLYIAQIEKHYPEFGDQLASYLIDAKNPKDICEAYEGDLAIDQDKLIEMAANVKEAAKAAHSNTSFIPLPLGTKPKKINNRPIVEGPSAIESAVQAYEARKAKGQAVATQLSKKGVLPAIGELMVAEEAVVHDFNQGDLVWMKKQGSVFMFCEKSSADKSISFAAPRPMSMGEAVAHSREIYTKVWLGDLKEFGYTMKCRRCGKFHARSRKEDHYITFEQSMIKMASKPELSNCSNCNRLTFKDITSFDPKEK